MKLYKNITRFGYYRLMYNEDIKFLLWTKTLKIGDIIGSCSGFNAKIKSISFDRMNYRNGWFVKDVVISDIDGGYHSSYVCISPKFSNDQIVKYWSDSELQKYWIEGGWAKPFHLKIFEAIKNNQVFLDDDGLILPEFK